MSSLVIIVSESEKAVSYTKSVMKATPIKTIFEANRLCSIFAKTVCVEFVTICKNRKQSYEAHTTFLDVSRLIIGLSFFVWLLFDISKFTFQENSGRSILFEMQIVLISRIETIFPAIIIINAFVYRFHFFKYLKNIHFIDERVSRALK